MSQVKEIRLTPEQVATAIERAERNVKTAALWKDKEAMTEILWNKKENRAASADEAQKLWEGGFIQASFENEMTSPVLCLCLPDDADFELRPVSPWRDAEREKPEERQTVLAIAMPTGNETYAIPILAYHIVDPLPRWCWYGSSCGHATIFGRVTHWMPLPEMPEKENGR